MSWFIYIQCKLSIIIDLRFYSDMSFFVKLMIYKPLSQISLSDHIFVPSTDPLRKIKLQKKTSEFEDELMIYYLIP